MVVRLYRLYPRVSHSMAVQAQDGFTWIYHDLPIGSRTNPKEVQDRVQNDPERRTTSSVSSQFSVQPAQIHSKPTGSLNIMISWQIFWNSHITILVYYTITALYILNIYYTSLTTGASHQRPYHPYPCTAAPGMRSLEISANVGTLSACEPRNLDSPVQNQGITRMWSVQYMNSIYISIQLNHVIINFIQFLY
jgi:hypothetical protein